MIHKFSCCCCFAFFCFVFISYTQLPNIRILCSCIWFQRKFNSQYCVTRICYVTSSIWLNLQGLCLNLQWQGLCWVIFMVIWKSLEISWKVWKFYKNSLKSPERSGKMFPTILVEIFDRNFSFLFLYSHQKYAC